MIIQSKSDESADESLERQAPISNGARPDEENDQRKKREDLEGESRDEQSPVVTVIVAIAIIAVVQ